MMEISSKASRASIQVKPPVIEPNKVCIVASNEPARSFRKSSRIPSSLACDKCSVQMSVKIKPKRKMINPNSTADHAIARKVMPIHKSNVRRERTKRTRRTIRKARVILAMRRIRSSRMFVSTFACPSSSFDTTTSMMNSKRLVATMIVSSSIQPQSSPQKIQMPRAINRSMSSIVKSIVNPEAIMKRKSGMSPPGFCEAHSTCTAMKMLLVTMMLAKKASKNQPATKSLIFLCTKRSQDSSGCLSYSARQPFGTTKATELILVVAPGESSGCRSAVLTRTVTLWLRRLGFSGLEWEALECDECTDPSDGTLPDEFGSKDGGVADILLTLAPLRSSDVLTSKVIFVIQSSNSSSMRASCCRKIC
mmetsp:Transcript_1602/g.3335  ORF Transcript_1602/g.3335 Transcript_1602/m.3335 type:complete len:364 (-) Transcript_1602:220-1311(-)